MAYNPNAITKRPYYWQSKLSNKKDNHEVKAERKEDWRNNVKIWNKVQIDNNWNKYRKRSLTCAKDTLAESLEWNRTGILVPVKCFSILVCSIAYIYQAKHLCSIYFQE